MAIRSEDLLAEEWQQRLKPKPGRTLIVGSKVYDGRADDRAKYENAVGVDMLDGQGVDYVLNLENPAPAWLGKFAHIECCSVLEHSKRPWALAQTLCDLLEDDGTIFVRVPWVWRFHGYPNDYFRFTPEGMKSLFPLEWKETAILCEGRIERKLPRYHLNGLRVFERAEVMGFACKSSSPATGAPAAGKSAPSS